MQVSQSAITVCGRALRPLAILGHSLHCPAVSTFDVCRWPYRSKPRHCSAGGVKFERGHRLIMDTFIPRVAVKTVQEKHR